MSAMTVQLKRLRVRLADFPEAVAFISFVGVFLFFSIANEHFLTPISISNILTFGSITGIVVVGVAMLMVSGEFDLSVGSTFAVASYVFALTMNAGVPPVVAMVMALLFSAILGLINGVFVVYTRIPSFIATLGTMLAYRGIARAIGQGKFATYKGEHVFLFDVLNGSVDRLNRLFTPAATFRMSIFWFAVIAIVMTFVLLRTRYGNWVYATGGNAEAARAQGVPVNFVRVNNFIIAASLAGLAGVIQFAHRTSVDPLRGAGMELIAVAAAVIGGVQLTGGYGTIFGATAGIMLIQMLEQGLVLMQVPIQVFQAFAGLTIILAVISNQYLGKYG